MGEDWFKTTGKIIYGPGIRIVVEVEEDIVKYYRSLIPKSTKVNPQMYSAHVSVVRIWEESHIKNMEKWGRFPNMGINVLYEPIIRNDDTYWDLMIN